jgi:translation initiation factor IF-2
MKKRLAYVNMPQKEFEDFISYEKQFLEFLSKEKFTDLMVIINKKDFIHNWALTEEEYSKLEQSLNILSLKKEMNARLGYKSNQKTQPLKTNI